MPREPRLALQHVLEAILEIEQFALGKTIEDYRSDRLLRRGVERRVEIISEASRSIPDDFKADPSGPALARHGEHRQSAAP
jgi:uncharacterized protein with HEPN domain